MPELHMIDSLTDAGHPGRINEDAHGWNASAAFVLDGATTLGPSVAPPPLTDAAWLAGSVSARLRENLTPPATAAGALRLAIAGAATRFHEMADGTLESGTLEPWRYPVASLLGVRVAPEGATLFGLGDTVAFIRDGSGATLRWTPAAYGRDNERALAQAALERNNGFGSAGAAYDEAQALAELRRKRAQRNRPGGSWLVGVVPEAADHLQVRELDLSGPVTVLLCTDGFAELVDHYRRHDPESLLEAALRRGLSSLCAELRHIERQEDPEGRRYPRFKQSDDATALLARIG